MILPDNFSFSQANLQDFVDCEFRFYLRHIRRLEWPAVESEPLRLQEAKMEAGFQFHRLVQQYFSGVSPEILGGTIESSEMSDWWNEFLKLDIDAPSDTRYVEKIFSTSLLGYRIVAKYDFMLKNNDGKTIIYDWKTSVIQPNRIFLKNRIQSKVYPAVFILQQNKNSLYSLNNPYDLEMIYWYPAFPHSPVNLMYSQTQYEDDVEFLKNLISQILTKSKDNFQKTSEDKKCAFCRYRSLCERGISAGFDAGEELEFPSDDPFYLNFDSL